LPLLNIGTFLLGDIATFFLGNIFAFLFRDVTALLGWNISTLLRVVNLLADLLVDGVALLGVNSVAFFTIDSITLLSVDSVAFTLGHILAFFLGDSVTLPLIDHGTLLLRNLFANLVLDSLALPIVDDLALSHGAGGALLLCHGLALGLIPGGAGLGGLCGARFLVEGFLDGSWDVDALQFLSIEALLLLNSRTLLVDIIGRRAVPLDLNGTFSSLNLFLDRSLGDLTLPLLGVSTGLALDVSALLPGHRVIGGLRNLITDLLGHLAAHGLRLRSSARRLWSSARSLGNLGVELVRNIGQSEKKGHEHEELHLA